MSVTIALPHNITSILGRGMYKKFIESLNPDDRLKVIGMPKYLDNYNFDGWKMTKVKRNNYKNMIIRSLSISNIANILEFLEVIDCTKIEEVAYYGIFGMLDEILVKVPNIKKLVIRVYGQFDITIDIDERYKNIENLVIYNECYRPDNHDKFILNIANSSIQNISINCHTCELFIPQTVKSIFVFAKSTVNLYMVEKGDYSTLETLFLQSEKSNITNDMINEMTRLNALVIDYTPSIMCKVDGDIDNIDRILKLYIHSNNNNKITQIGDDDVVEDVMVLDINNGW